MTLLDPPPKQVVTRADLAGLRDDDKLYELVGGELVEKQMSVLSQWVTSRVDRALGNFVDANPLGHVLVEQMIYCFAWDPDHGRRPDVCFVSAERLPDGLTHGDLEVAPDLAVEVLSPGNLARDVEDKIDEYLRAGVRLIWILDPDHRTVRVIGRDGTSAFLRPGQTLTAGDVLPGFAAAVESLFPPPPVATP